MSTAISLINKALYLNGCSSQANPTTPELVQLTFEALVDMLEFWEGQNIILGLTIPSNQADELNNPPDTNLSIQYNLSELSAPIFQKVAPQFVIDKADEYWKAMLTSYAVKPVSYYPTTLPIGSGNDYDINREKFYRYPDDILNNNGSVPLLAGDGS